MPDTHETAAKAVKILVVEDSPTQLEALRYLLEESDFSVIVASNGREGLSAAKANPVDLVVSDIVMPEMDGHALCKALRADEALRHLPVILLTSLTDPRDVIQGLQSGANNFICKPYDDRTLLARVQNVLANQEIRKAQPSEMGISIFFAGERFFITADRLQILDLLLSTYENAVSRNSELIHARDELRILNEQLEARVAERTKTLVAEIDERKRAEEARKESEKRFRGLFENAAVGIYQTTPDGRILMGNPVFCQILGHSSIEALQRRNLEEEGFYPEYNRSLFKTLLEEKGYLIGFEDKWTKADGTKVFIRESARVVRDDAGKVLYYEGYVEDISERKRAEERLQASENLLRIAGRMAAIGGWQVNLADNRVTWSDEVASIHEMPPGYSPTVAEGIGFYAPEWRKQITALFSACAREGTSYDEQMEILSASGRRVWVRTSGQAIRDETGTITCVEGAFQDITVFKKAEEEIRTLNASLEQEVQVRTAQLLATNQELEAFAYSISHDLKAPLRSVSGFNQMVLEQFAHLLPPKGQDLLLRAQAEAVRMSNLIDDLLRLSRIGLQEMSIMDADLTALALSVLQSLALSEPNRQVHCEVDPGLHVKGDPILMRVILENLLGNAWKFTSKVENACIQVRKGSSKPGWSQFSVSDNGAGFDSTYGGRLFTPFSRLHSEAEFPGTGIGLAIVRRIANRHGAEVRAEGHPGQGATFTLTFPVQDS